MAERWWNAGQADAHLKASAVLAGLEEQQAARLKDYTTAFRLFGRSSAVGLGPNQFFRVEGAKKRRLSFNIVRSGVETLASRITKVQVKPSFLTSGGSWSAQKKAKLLTKFVDGQFHVAKVREISPKIWLDAALFNLGVAKIHEDRDAPGQISFQRTYPEEIIVDEVESLYGNPRQMFQCRPVSRDKLIADFPKFKDQIASARKAFDSHEGPADLVVLREGWHLPSKPADPEDPESKASTDGRHILFVDGVTLDSEAYAEPDYPFEFMRWRTPLRGFAEGDGIPGDLAGIQYAINDTLLQIEECIHWAGPRAFVQAGSNVNKSHLDDTIGAIIEYDVVKPDISAVSTVPPELFTYLRLLIESGYDSIGLSKYSATSEKPAGLNSGVALREYNDNESERFLAASREWERFHLAVAAKMIRLATVISKRDGSYGVTAAEKRFTQEIKFKDAHLAPSQYVMQVLPASALPDSKAGRLDMVNDLIQLGLIDKDEARSLLNWPDLESSAYVAEAEADLVSWQIERMLEGGKAVSPDPMQNFDYALRQAKAAYKRALTHTDVSFEKRDLLRLYIQQLVALGEANAAPALAPAGAPQALPPGPQDPGVVPPGGGEPALDPAASPLEAVA